MAVKGTVYSCGGFETVGGDAGEGETVGGASARSEEEGWKWAATLLSERRAPLQPWKFLLSAV